MARLNYIEYFKRALLEFMSESDPLYAMLQWMTHLRHFGRLKKCTPLEFAGNLKVFAWPGRIV